MHKRNIILAAILVPVIACMTASLKKSAPAPIPQRTVLKFSDSLNHSFVLGNKISGFFVGQMKKYNASSYQGWTVNEAHILRDYYILADGQDLDRDSAQTFLYFPNGFQRSYTDDLQEEVLFLDSVDVLIIRLKGPCEFSLRLDTGSEIYALGQEHPQQIIRFGDNLLEARLFQRNAQVTEFRLGLNGALKTSGVWGQSYEKLLEKVRQNLPAKVVTFKDTLIDKAAFWSGLALDNLITQQRGTGIWAGLPWFNNYWGRDTFISFDGALLVRGKFNLARKILRNFAGFQLKDSSDLHFGRIPNRITNQEVIYNTADASWWFVRELYEYYLYTADLDLLTELFPVVRTAIEGALQKRCDTNAFLMHGDAETWMDAKGAEGAWSPRGNRAVEVQALWYTALQLGGLMAEETHQSTDLARHWQSVAARLKHNFNEQFWDSQHALLFDHLNTDGTPDSSLRPNQIFAITVPDISGIPGLLDFKKQRQIAQTVTEKLTQVNGVMSLWSGDKNFHPYHHYQPYYVPDAAYHNGLIWTWLAGPVASSLAKFGQSERLQELLQHESRQIIYWDAVGNYSELVEPVLRPGAEQLKISGTVSQAWNLAEFQRNLIQDRIGYLPVAQHDSIYIQPSIPKQFRGFKARLPYKNSFIDFELIPVSGVVQARLESSATEKIHLGIRLSAKTPMQYFELTKDHPLSVSVALAEIFKHSAENWKFTDQPAAGNFSVLSSPDFEILSRDQIVLPVPSKPTEIMAAADALFDDKGPNKKYIYPQNQAFKEGIADIASCKIIDLEAAWGFIINFRKLTDPGWHPEYGFQLTFLAIAVQTNTETQVKQREIGRQAFYNLPKGRYFNRIIFVGGGLEIQNSSGKRMAQFIPQKSGDALGFAAEKQLRFKISKKYLPGFSSGSRVTLLSGLQDDHGGAGIGEFRAVQQQASQWNGGGADQAKNNCAVYDVLEINN